MKDEIIAQKNVSFGRRIINGKCYYRIEIPTAMMDEIGIDPIGKRANIFLYKSGWLVAEVDFTANMQRDYDDDTD